MIGFNRVKLGDVLIFQRGFDITKDEQEEGDIPIISSSGVTSYHKQWKVKGPGVIIGRKGTLGTVHYAPTNYWPHDTTLWIKDFKGNHPKFIYYFLQTLRLENFDAGASNPTLNRNHLHKVTVIFPEIHIQERIAAILSTYDDLIKNNKRRIALLEKMGEEIYREWFVRMRFPGHEKVKIKKGLPEGWSILTIDELSNEIRKGIKKNNLNAEIKYLGLEHIPRKSISITDFTTADFVQSDKLLFKERDILFGKIRPYLHKVAIASISGACSSDTIVLRPKQAKHEGFLLFTVFSETFVELASIASKGTKMPRADWNFLKKLELKVPDDYLMDLFQNKFNDIFLQLVNLIKSNQLLASSRDMLLTRLISGKLPVENLDIQFPPRMLDKTEGSPTVNAEKDAAYA